MHPVADQVGGADIGKIDLVDRLGRRDGFERAGQRQGKAAVTDVVGPRLRFQFVAYSGTMGGTKKCRYRTNRLMGRACEKQTLEGGSSLLSAC